MKKIKALVIALAIVAVATGGILPQQASASSCGATRICLWDGNNYSGSTVTMIIQLQKCLNIPSWANNMANSAMNGTAYNVVYLYDGVDCTGQLYPVYSGVPNLGGFSNRATSVRAE